MRQVTGEAILCVIDWNPSHPRQLTTLFVDGDSSDAAERAAASALTGTAGLTSWLALPTATRKRLVRTCRSIPALGLDCVIDEEQAEATSDFLPCAVQDTVEQFLPRFRGWGEVHVALGHPSKEFRDAVQSNLQIAGIEFQFLDGSRFPGLCELARLSALVCRETECKVDTPEGEDLLEIYHTYAVGGLSSGGEWPW